MRFSIHHKQENNLDLIVLQDSQTKTEAVVLPAFGALLHEFSIVINNKLFNIIDNYKSSEHIKNELSVNFKSAKLSPFACRIPDGKYSFNENNFEFQTRFMDGSAIHGLLYNKPFALIKEFASDENASITLQYDYKKDDAGYPYNYRCEIEYTLSDNNSLQVKTTINNLSDVTIPIADGWHPYFQLGGKIDNWSLQFNAENILEFDDKLIPTGKLLNYNKFNQPHLIEDTELDNCFLLNKAINGAACRLINPSNKLSLSFFPDKNYPYLQIYTPPNRASIAIENLSAAPDAFNNKMGLTLLLAGSSQTFTVIYQTGIL
jgi:aldose 1-epimerase